MRPPWTFPDTLRRMLRNLFQYRHRRHYADYHDKGYPIGTGTVESACEVVVQQRMVQASMRWSRLGLEAILALRCELLGLRWKAS